MNPEDLLLLVTRAMPFGKHKGTVIDTPYNSAIRHLGSLCVKITG